VKQKQSTVEKAAPARVEAPQTELAAPSNADRIAEVEAEQEVEAEAGYLESGVGEGVAAAAPGAPPADGAPGDAPPNSEAPGGGGGPSGAPVDGALVDVFGPRVRSLPSFRTHAAAAQNLHAKAFTLGQHVTLGEGIDPTDIGDRVSMEVIGEEVAHALAGGGSGQHAVDQPGDPGEASAQASGATFADYVLNGGPVPSLGPAYGGKARIHRATEDDSDQDSGHDSDRDEDNDSDRDEDNDSDRDEEAAEEAAEEAQEEAEEAQEDMESAAEDLSEDLAEDVAADVEAHAEEIAEEIAEEAALEEAVEGDVHALEGPEAALDPADIEALEAELEAELPTVAEQATALMEEDLAAIAELEGQERIDAILESSANLGTTLAEMSPQEQAELLEGAGAEAISGLVDEISELEGTERAEAMAGLLDAGETVGMDNVGALADIMSESSIPANDPSLMEAVETSITQGNGSLMAAAMIESYGSTEAGTRDLVETFGRSTHQVQEAFREALSERTTLDGQLAEFVENQQAAGIGQEHIEAGVDAFMAEHAEAYAAFDNTAGVYASTLQGTAYAVDHVVGDRTTWNDRHGNTRQGQAMGDLSIGGTGGNLTNDTLGEILEDGMYMAPAAAQSEVGRAVMADAMLQSGAGQRTFYDTLEANEETLNARAEREANGQRHTSFDQRMENAVLQTGFTALTGAAGTLDVENMQNAIDGLARQVDDPELADAITAAGVDFSELATQAQNGEVTAQDFLNRVGSGFAGAARDQTLTERQRQALGAMGSAITLGSAGLALTDGITAREALTFGSSAANFTDQVLDARGVATQIRQGQQQVGDWADSGFMTRGSARVIGRGLGTVNSVVGAIQDGNVTARETLTVALEGVSTGLETARVLGRLGDRGLRVAGAVGRLSGAVGIAFSAWDTARAIDQGDWVGAAAAAAPLVGAGIGAALTSWTGPGAAVGALVGGVIGLGVEGIRMLVNESPREALGNNTLGAAQAMMESMGLPADQATAMAERLSGYDRDLVSAMPALGRAAEELGVPVEDLLQHVAGLSSREMRQVFRQAGRVRTNADAIEEEMEAYSGFRTDDPPTTTLRAEDGRRLDRLVGTLGDLGLGS
jgi:hypothetical protein